MHKKIFLTIFLTLFILNVSGCGLFPKRKANVIISSVSPASLNIQWTQHTATNYYSYVGEGSSFTFRETGGETWAQITNYAVTFAGSDGTDLSAYNFSGGLNLFIDKSSSDSATITVYSQPLIEATAPTSNTPYLTIQVTITFSGKDGVGNNITLIGNYTITQNLLTTVAD